MFYMTLCVLQFNLDLKQPPVITTKIFLAERRSYQRGPTVLQIRAKRNRYKLYT